VASARSCMTGRGMQDKALRVSVHTCDVLTLTARLTPQGPPSMYGSLETPCGQKFEVVPESYLLRGATSAFCFAAAGADPGLTTVVVGAQRTSGAALALLCHRRSVRVRVCRAGHGAASRCKPWQQCCSY